MRTILRLLPLLLVAALLVPAPCAAHISKDIEDQSTGQIAPGVNCTIVPHILSPEGYAPAGMHLYIRKPDIAEDRTGEAGRGYPVWAVVEDTQFTLKTNHEEFWAAVEPKIKETIAASSEWRSLTPSTGGQGEPIITITPLRNTWYLIEYEVNEQLQVSAKGNAKIVNSSGFDLDVQFGTPIDPLPSVGIVARHYFKWSIKSPDGSVEYGNDEEFIPISPVGFLIADKTPPNAIGFSPSVLFGTTGDTIAKFNEHRDRRGISLVPANPGELLLFVSDNARYAYAGGQGVHHKRDNIQALLYAETYLTSVTDEKPARAVRPIEHKIGEYFQGNDAPPAYPAGMGKFAFVGPIDLRKDLGLVPQTTMNAVAGAGQDSETINIHVWRIPVADLESKLHARLLAQYGAELSGQRRPAFLDHHFAGAVFFEYLEKSWQPPHWNDNLAYSDIDGNALQLGGFDFLRITAAVSDAAGNWTLPEASDAFLEWDAKNDIPAGTAARVSAYHRFLMPLVVFDNDKPNVVLMVTAQGRSGETRTTRFTIPNGDLAHKEKEQSGAPGEIGPWFNDDPVWIFDWKGESPTMQWLKANDPKRFDEFKQSLEILENTRVIFDCVAYDNVNKIVRRDDNDLFTKWGVVTPVAMPKDATDLELERPITWRIFDPTVPDESMLYEDPADKMYVYPDYIFRKVDETKMEPSADGSSGYGVEVLVNDRSNFNDPARNAGSMTNWRKVQLWFKVIPSAGTGIDRMGNEEKVGH